ncbi:hypothetical protein ASE63_06175 [Bosea sp. Root381]|nr:hypothetical protein ASE63_06175 [Bosea sp. Root381]
MACISATAADDRVGDGEVSMTRLARRWRRFWQRRAALQDQQEIADLDDQALRDLGLHRDMVEEPDPRAPGRLWLSRPGL